jgi:hypothetical protein
MEMLNSPIVGGGSSKAMGKHEWAGGSSVWQEAIIAFWDPVAGDTLFNATQTQDSAAKGANMLQRAAILSATVDGNLLSVTITNTTGHKLPTGYAEGRRMWIQVQGLITSTEVYSSGAPIENGGIHEVEEAKVYEIKLGLTEAHAQDIARPELAGEGFHFILNNTVFKDNRIPPRGFTNATYATKTMQPVGHSYADGQFWDKTLYTLPAGTNKVIVTLNFQSASDEYLDFLELEANDPVPDAVVGSPVNWGQVVGQLRTQFHLDRPVIMAEVTVDIPGGVQDPTEYLFVPLIP